MKRFFLGLLLSPTAVISLYAAGRSALPAAQQSHHLPFFAGFVGYPLLHFLVIRPLRLYVFGHELTHAFAAVLSGSRVKKFVAGGHSGHVVVSRSNTFIALAPYFIPIYSLLVLVAFRLATIWWQADAMRSAFLVAMGVTLAFHLVLTLDILVSEKQKDLAQAGGALFSLSLIALSNALVVVLLFKLLFPQAVSLKGFCATVFRLSGSFWSNVLRSSWEAGGILYDHIRVGVSTGAGP